MIAAAIAAVTAAIRRTGRDDAPPATLAERLAARGVAYGRRVRLDDETERAYLDEQAD